MSDQRDFISSHDNHINPILSANTNPVCSDLCVNPSSVNIDNQISANIYSVEVENKLVNEFQNDFNHHTNILNSSSRSNNVEYVEKYTDFKTRNDYLDNKISNTNHVRPEALKYSSHSQTDYAILNVNESADILRNTAEFSFPPAQQSPDVSPLPSIFSMSKDTEKINMVEELYNNCKPLLANDVFPKMQEEEICNCSTPLFSNDDFPKLELSKDNSPHSILECNKTISQYTSDKEENPDLDNKELQMLTGLEAKIEHLSWDTISEHNLIDKSLVEKESVSPKMCRLQKVIKADCQNICIESEQRGKGKELPKVQALQDWRHDLDLSGPQVYCRHCRQVKSFFLHSNIIKHMKESIYQGKCPKYLKKTFLNALEKLSFKKKRPKDSADELRKHTKKVFQVMKQRSRCDNVEDGSETADNNVITASFINLKNSTFISPPILTGKPFCKDFSANLCCRANTDNFLQLTMNNVSAEPA